MLWNDRLILRQLPAPLKKLCLLFECQAENQLELAQP